MPNGTPTFSPSLVIPNIGELEKRVIATENYPIYSLTHFSKFWSNFVNRELTENGDIHNVDYGKFSEEKAKKFANELYNLVGRWYLPIMAQQNPSGLSQEVYSLLVRQILGFNPEQIKELLIGQKPTEAIFSRLSNFIASNAQRASNITVDAFVRANPDTVLSGLNGKLNGKGLQISDENYLRGHLENIVPDYGAALFDRWDELKRRHYIGPYSESS